MTLLCVKILILNFKENNENMNFEELKRSQKSYPSRAGGCAKLFDLTGYPLL
jgi:hypothetical protein